MLKGVASLEAEVELMGDHLSLGALLCRREDLLGMGAFLCRREDLLCCLRHFQSKPNLI